MDYDPVVVSHGQALLTVSDLSIMVQGMCGVPPNCSRCRRARGYLAMSHIGTEFFPDRQALADATAVYEKASERVWPRSRDQILGFFDGFELLKPGLVPTHQWRPPIGRAATDTPTSSGER